MPKNQEDRELVRPAAPSTEDAEVIRFFGGIGSAEGAGTAAAAGTSGGGAALPHRQELEASFGVDLGHVRAHTGGGASQACEALGAEAYATGNDVVFGSANPSLFLVAHEVAHTFQQGGAGLRRYATVGTRGDSYEQQADQVASAVVSGHSVDVGSLASGGAPQIQRNEAPGGGAAAGGVHPSIKATLTGNAGSTGARVPLTGSTAAFLNMIYGFNIGTAAAQPGESSAANVPRMQADDANRGATAQRVSGSAFVNDAGTATSGANASAGVSHNDIQQGHIGDCYLMGLLAAIARVRPDFIASMIQDHGDGTYTVTFRGPEFWGQHAGVAITVDSTFWMKPDGTPVYARAGDRSATAGPELWPMIIEKAWAQLQGSYENTVGGKNQGTADFFQIISGNKARNLTPTSLPGAMMLMLCVQALNNRTPVYFGSKSADPDGALEAAGVVPNHAYALMGATASSVSLYNAWGNQHLENKSWDFIVSYFSEVRLVDLG